MMTHIPRTKMNPYKREQGKIPEFVDYENMDESQVDKLSEALKL